MSEMEFFSQDTVTADDVAAAAGVSRWTVARAFKKDASISRKSRQKVIEAAERLGYVPDLLASSLASDRSNLVALVADDFTNPHKLVMLERLTRILRKRGVGVLLVNMLGESDPSSALLAASQRRVDAAVVIGTNFDDRVLDTALGARRVKKLVIFARMSQNPHTVTIACDDQAAIREIAEYLFAKGYRRPMFVAGPDTQSARLHRRESFVANWQRLAGAIPPAVHVQQYDMACAVDGICSAFGRLSRSELPDVLVCENDIIAIGAMDALRYRLGLRVPEDVAVTGFDDIPLAASPAYDLTTFRQPITRMAEALARLLEEGSSDDAILPGTFITRSSA